MNRNDARWPGQVIIDGRDFMQQVALRLQPFQLSERDRQEVITQLLDFFLNHDVKSVADLAQFEVRFHLMSSPTLRNPATMHQFSQVMEELVQLLYAQLGSLRILVNGQFPYIFERFIGSDILVSHIPF